MASASWQDLLQNVAILAIAVTVWNHGLDRLEGKARWYRELFGICLGGTSVVLLMLVPFELQPGIIVDLRGTLIVFAGFVGGPLIGIATALVAIGFRIYLGGAGTLTGMVTIVTAVTVGIVGHVVVRGRATTTRDLLVLAFAASLSTSCGLVVMPQANILPFLIQVWPPLVIMTFVATMLAGLAIIEADRRRQTIHANVFYRSIIDALPEPVNAKDLAGRFLAANPATAHQVGAPNVAALIGRTDFDFFPQDVANGFRADEERVLAAGEPDTVEQMITRDDGSRQWLSTLKVPLRDQGGAVVGLLTHNHDITERKRMEDEIAESRRRLNDAMEHMVDGLVMFDKDAHIVLCNDQYRAMFPASAELRVPGAWLGDILRASITRGDQTGISQNDVEAWIRRTLDAFRQPGETDLQMKDGRWLRARVRPTADGGSLTVMTDVTQAKHAETILTDLNRRLANLASEDGLTGLTNRRGFDEALTRAFALSRRNGAPLSLLLIDVDRFKHYNDTCGHPAGDICLRTVGSLLKRTLQRPGDVAVRHGGDEFAAILPDTPEEGAMLLAETVRKKVHDLGLQHSGNPLGIVTISVGVVTMTADDAITRAEELTARADAALYAAKAAGRDRVMTAAPEQRLAANG